MSGKKQKFRKTKTGIFIIGEGITEQYYFKHLKNIYDFRCHLHPRLFHNNCINDISKAIKELSGTGIIILCVFDADVAKRNKSENQKLKELHNEYENDKNIIFCDSLPSIEYWFLLHYKDTCPNYTKASEAEKQLKKHIKNYKKKEFFLKNEKWARDMSIKNNGLSKAMKRAKKYKDSNAAYSNVYKAIGQLNKTID